MKEVELPPDVPQFGDLSPTEKLKKPELKLPDVPLASETKESENELPNLKPQPSLTEDLNKELDEEFKKIRKVELPKPETARVVAAEAHSPSRSKSAEHEDGR